SPEHVELEAGRLGDLLRHVQRGEIQEWLEEIAAREVLRAIAAELAERQGPGLLDAVLRLLERDRQVGIAVSPSALREDLAEPNGRLITPAVLCDQAARDVVVERRHGAAEPEPKFPVAETSTFHLRHELAALLTSPRDDVERAAERVPAEERGRPANDLDPLDVVERDQIEVDLFDGRLV